MNILITVSIVVGCVVGWLFLAATAVRWFDLSSARTWGLDEEDRFMAWTAALVFTPLALLVAGFMRLYKTGGSNNFIHRYTAPTERRYEIREKKKSALYRQGNEMDALARQCKDATEKKILIEAARSFRSQAHSL